MAPARRGGATAAPRFVDARYRRDPWIGGAVLRNRGRAVGLFDAAAVPELSKPSLVSSAHGHISRVLLTLPWWLFLTEEEAGAGEWPGVQTTAAAFRSLARALPRDTRFVILVHERAMLEGKELFDPRDRLRTWLSEDGIAGRAEVVAAPGTMSFTIWAEDAYAVCRDLADSDTFLIEPASFRRADDAYVADLVAPGTGLGLTQASLYFQGGNILVGDDFWLIGMDYPNSSLELGYVTPAPGESRSAAVARAYGAALDGERRMISVGSRAPVPGFAGGALRRPFELDGERWTEILYSGNEPGTVQPIFHIDMFLTLAGRDEDGRYVILVGDPHAAAKVLDQPLPAHGMALIFDDIARQLADLGFRVVRNPLPLTYDDDDKTRTRSWYFATANNALVEVTASSRDVWLPTYGHRKWPELAATDAENRRVWEGLGFEVHELGDFHAFAVNLGAVHCVKKYLARG